jgi:hypothetical protein
VADILQGAIDKDKETAIALKHGAWWSGRIPFLRLIHCITEGDLTTTNATAFFSETFWA